MADICRSGLCLLSCIISPLTLNYAPWCMLYWATAVFGQHTHTQSLRQPGAAVGLRTVVAVRISSSSTREHCLTAFDLLHGSLTAMI